MRVELKPVHCRDLNAATSQEVFAGPYLDDPAEKEKFSSAFMDMTQGFLAFPLCIPGTAVWKGKQGRLYIISVLKKAAARSKISMQVSPHFLLFADQRPGYRQSWGRGRVTAKH